MLRLHGLLTDFGSGGFGMGLVLRWWRGEWMGRRLKGGRFGGRVTAGQRGTLLPGRLARNAKLVISKKHKGLIAIQIEMPTCR